MSSASPWWRQGVVNLRRLFFFFFQNLNILLYKVIPKIVLHFFTIYFNSRTFVKAVHFRNPGRNSTSYRLFKYCLQKVLKKKQNRGVQMNLFTKRKQSNRCRKQTYGYQGIRAGGINWEIGTDMYILPYIKQITNKNLLYSTGNSTQYSVMAYMGKESKKEWIYVYV